VYSKRTKNLGQVNSKIAKAVNKMIKLIVVHFMAQKILYKLLKNAKSMDLTGMCLNSEEKLANTRKL
jgi:hypothetical protein